MLKKGILGGVFNPVHEGHIAIAEQAMRHTGLDEVIFLPAGRPPHKDEATLADAMDRANMVALAIAAHPAWRLSRAELKRSSVSYTVDTLETMVAPGEKLYLILGSDALHKLTNWYRAERLADLCEILIAPRQGDCPKELNALVQTAAQKLGVHIEVMAEYGPEISSSDIREQLARGEKPAVLPAAVAEYIACHALYGADYGPMAQQLRKSMSESRFRHTLSVARCAVELAEVHGVDPINAHLAAMLHDCAKGMDAQTLRRMIREGGISADEQELSMPALLHAPAGVHLARQQYHVTDTAVLSAIRWHTTGRRNMTRLEKVIYLADAIEPGRAPYNGLEEIRTLAYKNLDAAVRTSAARTAAFVAARGKKLHARTTELTKSSEQ